MDLLKEARLLAKQTTMSKRLKRFLELVIPILAFEERKEFPVGEPFMPRIPSADPRIPPTEPYIPYDPRFETAAVALHRYRTQRTHTLAIMAEILYGTAQHDDVNFHLCLDVAESHLAIVEKRK